MEELKKHIKKRYEYLKNYDNKNVVGNDLLLKELADLLFFINHNTRPSVLTEEEIEVWVKNHGYCGHCTQEYHEGLEEGAKWALNYNPNK